MAEFFWFTIINGRRHDLIEKKFGAGLTERETGELAELQAAVSAAVDVRCPYDWGRLDEMEKRLQELDRLIAEGGE